MIPSRIVIGAPSGSATPATSYIALAKRYCQPTYSRAFATSSSQSATAASGSSATSDSALSFPSHIRNPSPYDIFHLSRECSAAQVKSRYYDLVKTLHPDRRLAGSRGPLVESDDSGKGKGKAPPTNAAEEQAKEEFRLVVKAYELLSNKKRRSAYDRWGIGWSLSSSTDASNPFGASDAEWMELSRRRRQRSTNPGQFAGWNSHTGHDSGGWQRDAGAFNAFYAHAGMPKDAQDGFSFDSNYPPPGSAQPRYASNKRFISAIAILTWTLAIFQFHRLSYQSQQAVNLADKRHLDAVRNLEEARESAKSHEGLRRMEALRRRAREDKTLREVDAFGSRTQISDSAAESPRLTETPPVDENPWGVGHGGPSGFEQHERNSRVAEARRKARMGEEETA